MFCDSFVSSMTKLAGSSKKPALPKPLKVPAAKSASKAKMQALARAVMSALQKQKMYGKMR